MFAVDELEWQLLDLTTIRLIDEQLEVKEILRKKVGYL